MKKHLIKLGFILVNAFLIINYTYWYNLPGVSFGSSTVSSQYTKFEKLLNDNYWAKITSLWSSDQILFENRIADIRSSFIKLDNNVVAKNKQEVGYTFTDIKNKIRDLIVFLKNIKINSIPVIPNVKLNEFAKEANIWYLTYYADFFEWRSTSNWDKFSHRYFSAAKCNIPLDTMMQIWIGGKSLLVKVNDRPNCSRFPDIIDLTHTAFDYLYARYEWKQKAEYVVLWKIYDDYYKMHVPNDYFFTANISLQWKIPNSYLYNESMHINWMISWDKKDVTLDITTPSGKLISLKKDVEKYFSFSYLMEEKGIYYISFNGSNKFKIYVLEDSSFAGKKFITQEIPKNDTIKVIKDSLGKWINGYRIVIKWDNYNIATINYLWKNYVFSWIWDMVIPEHIFWQDISNIKFNLNIKSTKTITGFSHDFYTEPVTIFSGNVGISE